MGSMGINVGLVMVLLTLFWAGAMAQSGCTSAIISLAPCLNYVSGSSSTPSASCCSQLAKVVQSQPQCLCTVLGGGGASMGVTINQTLALALPSACNVQTPPVSDCNAGGGTATSPFGSPQGSPGESPYESPVSPTSSSVAGAGSKTAPSTGGGTSDVSRVKVPFQLVGSVLVMASYASVFGIF